MAKIVTRTVKWNPPAQAAGITGYRIYVAVAGTPFAYTLPFAEVAANVNQLVIPCPALPQSMFSTEGNYSVWITSVEEGGNESDPLALGARFDFTPPPPPINGRIEIS